jgi:CMP-N,N'-diacetyllegionaminic acid synthase
MINDKSVLAVTLARGGSKGIHKKNITPLNGKPLLEYTIEEVKKSKYIDYYVVGTDDQDIKLVCSENDVNVINRKHVKDTQTTAEGLLEILEKLLQYDYVIEIMCTNPFKTVEDIDAVIEKLSESNGESVTSVTRIWDNHPNRVKFISNGILKGFNSEEDPDKPGWRRQDLTPAAYVRNGSLYAMTYNQIIKNKKRLTPQTHAYIMEENRSINIDEPIDLLIAEHLMKNENR